MADFNLLQSCFENLLIFPLASLVIEYWDSETSTLLCSSRLYGLSEFSTMWQKLPLRVHGGTLIAMACDEKTSTLYEVSDDYGHVQLRRFVLSKQRWDIIDYPYHVYYGRKANINIFFLNDHLYVYSHLNLYSHPDMLVCLHEPETVNATAWNPQFEFIQIPEKEYTICTSSVAYKNLLIVYTYHDNQIELNCYCTIEKKWRRNFARLNNTKPYNKASGKSINNVNLFALPFDDHLVLILWEGTNSRRFIWTLDMTRYEWDYVGSSEECDHSCLFRWNGLLCFYKSFGTSILALNLSTKNWSTVSLPFPKKSNFKERFPRMTLSVSMKTLSKIAAFTNSKKRRFISLD